MTTRTASVARRVKVVRGHTGWARFLADAGDNLGRIPRDRSIPSPYAFAPDHLVFEHNGRRVFAVETMHAVHAVFEVPADVVLMPFEDDEADRGSL